MIFCYKLGGACEEQIDVNFAVIARQLNCTEKHEKKWWLLWILVQSGGSVVLIKQYKLQIKK